MFRLYILGIVIILGVAPAHAQPGSRYPKLSPNPIPIHAWIGPPAAETTIERYRELKKAGFTHSFSNFHDAGMMEKALDIAHQCDIKLFINIPELHDNPEDTVKRFSAHPAIAGYHLRDEPDAKDFNGLAAWVKKIRTLDNKHFCYINLFPNYAIPGQLGTNSYKEYVDRFIAEVPVQVISFDHYPVIGDEIRPEWFENLEVISQGAQKAQKPFWAFALAVAHDPYPVPTLAHLRLQVFSNLAYGAQGIQYFTYWTPQSSRWNFHDGPIDRQGKRTKVYNLVRQVNSEIQALSRVFNGSRVISVAHTGETIPKGTKRFKSIEPFRDIITEGKGAVVSLLESEKSRFLVFVNRDIHNPMKLITVLDTGMGVMQIHNDGSMRTFALNRTVFNIEPGNVMIFMWK
jgi:hypothetical protein